MSSTLFYADDCQINMPFEPQVSLQSLFHCYNDIMEWLKANCLHLNDSKTEAVLFAPNLRHIIAINLSSISSYLGKSVTTIGLKLYSALKMDLQVHFQQRLMSKLKPILHEKHLESVIHTFITSHLDYSNSSLVGINKASLSRLQLVQNAAARCLTGAARREHMIPVLKSLH